MTNGNGKGAAVTVVAPAKLNLALLVGPVRPDGFHEVASLMVPVTLADRVTIEHTAGQGLSVVCDVAPGEDNLSAQMVRELEVRLERVFEVRVTIAKNVPAGGGLGGGSSDAAATLAGIEQLFDLDVASRVRFEAAAAVGSDVPFFLWPGPQLAMGRGQVLKPVELPALHLVVAVPDLSLATGDVYGWHDQDAAADLASFVPRSRRLSQDILSARTVAAVAALVRNDLEECVVARRPQVGALCDRLRSEGALAAAMTGSGAAVFGLFPDAGSAAQAHAALAPLRAWHVTDLQPLSTDGSGAAAALGRETQ